MSNGINQRQNEQESIQKLIAQRNLYSCAKKINEIKLILCIIFPLLISLFSLKEKYDILYAYSFISFLLFIIFEKIQNNCQKKASKIQLEFDLYVFNMPWTDMFGKKEMLGKDIFVYSKNYKLKKNESFNNWYKLEYDSLSLNNGIISCQKENVVWDNDLRSKYLFFLAILSSIISILFVVRCINLNITLIELFIKLNLFISPINYLVKAFIKIKNDCERCSYIEALINNDNDVMSIEKLQIIQMHIHNHRQNNFNIPNWFFELFRKYEEDIINNMK